MRITAITFLLTVFVAFNAHALHCPTGICRNIGECPIPAAFPGGAATTCQPWQDCCGAAGSACPYLGRTRITWETLPGGGGQRQIAETCMHTGTWHFIWNWPTRTGVVRCNAGWRQHGDSCSQSDNGQYMPSNNHSYTSCRTCPPLPAPNGAILRNSALPRNSRGTCYIHVDRRMTTANIGEWRFATSCSITY